MQDFFPAPSWRLKAGRKAFWQAGESVMFFPPDLSGGLLLELALPLFQDSKGHSAMRSLLQTFIFCALGEMELIRYFPTSLIN